MAETVEKNYLLLFSFQEEEYFDFSIAVFTSGERKHFFFLLLSLQAEELIKVA